MNILIKNTLQNKLFITNSIIVFISISVLVGIGGYLSRNKNITNATELYKSKATQTGIKIQSELEKQLSANNTMANVMGSLSDPFYPFSLDRHGVLNYMKFNLTNNSQLTEITMVWEQGAFDKKDKFYKNTPGHDSSGRFIPKMKKLPNGDLITELSEEYNDYKNGKFYTETKSKLNETILKPTCIRAGGAYSLRMPIISPIISSGKFLGVLETVNIINWIQNNIVKIQKDQDYQVAIILNDGTILAYSGNSFLIGKQFTEIFPEDVEIYKQLINNEEFKTVIDKDYVISSVHDIGKTNKTFQSIIILPKQKITESGNILLFFMTLGGILLFILTEIILYYSIISLTVPFSKSLKNLKKISTGDIEEEYFTDYKIKEFNELTEISNKIAKTIKNIKIIANAVSKGNFNQQLKSETENDTIVESLNQMTLSLKSIQENENLRKQEEDKLSWIRQGVAKLGETLRLTSKSVDVISENIVQNMVQYMDAMLGGIFLYYETENNEQYLDLTVSFAYNIKKSYKKKFLIGEGLVGTCAFERKVIYITDLPDNYIEISSGLGNAKPTSLLLLPLNFEDQLMGVLEMAFLKKLQPHEIQFATQLSENIASAIATAKINQKTSTLLEETQQQKEILAVKENELRKNLEQLHITQQESVKREAEMKGILDAVNNTILTIEYTTEGILLNANDKYLKTMHYNINELRGVNVLDLVKTEREELKQVIDSVAKGNFHQKVMKRFTKFGEVRWLLSTYTPFYDVDGKITKILYFAYDITESKTYSEELEKRELELKNKLKITELELEKAKKKITETENKNHKN